MFYCRISGVQCLSAEKNYPTLKKKKKKLYNFQVHEFAYQWYERSIAFTLNQTNITSQSEFLLKHEMRIIVSSSRAAALMNGEARHVKKAARRDGQKMSI